MSNSCCISSAKKTFFVKDLHIFEALKMIYNSPNRPEKLYRLPYEYKKSKKMLKSCRTQLGQAYWSLFPPGWDISPSQGYPPSISSGFPDDPPVPIYTPERREERALPKNKTQWPGQVLNSGLSTWSLAHWPLGTCLLGGVGGGGLERGEAETGSVNKPAVKFGLEIEPLGHSDAMGEGGSSDNVLSILHHKFSSWSWGGGRGILVVSNRKFTWSSLKLWSILKIPLVASHGTHLPYFPWKPNDFFPPLPTKKETSGPLPPPVNNDWSHQSLCKMI